MLIVNNLPGNSVAMVQSSRGSLLHDLLEFGRRAVTRVVDIVRNLVHRVVRFVSDGINMVVRFAKDLLNMVF